MTTVGELMAILAEVDPATPIVGNSFGHRMVDTLLVDVIEAIRVVSPWGETLYDLADAATDYEGDEVAPVPVKAVRVRFAAIDGSRSGP